MRAPPKVAPLGHETFGRDSNCSLMRTHRAAQAYRIQRLSPPAQPTSRFLLALRPSGIVLITQTLSRSISEHSRLASIESAQAHTQDEH